MCGQGAGEWKLLATASSTTQQVATPWGRVGFLNTETKVKCQTKSFNVTLITQYFFMHFLSEISMLEVSGLGHS